MPVEFIGMIGTRSASELDGRATSLVGGHIDPPFVRDFVRAHEDAGFDRVLIGYGSSGPDGFSVASYCASVTDRIGFLIAHRPGFVAPTLAARKAATLDWFSGGRIALHIITGGSDFDQQRDGDWLAKDDRYRRTDEYLDIVRKTWTSDEPFDYDGEFYHVKRAISEVKPLQQPHVPVYFGGLSGPALGVGAKHADVYAMWGEPLASVRRQIAEVRGEAAKWGRRPGFSVSFRPILGATEAEAWDKAHTYLDRIKALRKGSNGAPPAFSPQAVGSQRLLALADRAEVHDERLWTAIAAAVGAYGNTTALVGTPEQVAASLLAYYDEGVTTLLIRGFEPLPDAIAYGRELIPLVREGVAKRDRAPAGVR
ncbi:MAG: LLM class flavin-dependent oxidoreductase [Chloroflexi bacterium]|nr:LLM class flavin-dependent oxidoreductase [Chloroflexota bacterium]